MPSINCTNIIHGINYQGGCLHEVSNVLNELRERIKERISEQGRITFADFMEAVFYYRGISEDIR